MMKRALVLSVALVLTISFKCLVYADLIDRGGGLIYDTDLDITWLQDANYAYTSGQTFPRTDGSKPWYYSLEWARNLSYYDSERDINWDDWRLPSCLDSDGVIANLTSDCTSNEMKHLFYDESGNFQGGPLINTGPFINIKTNRYWMGSTYSGNQNEKYFFNFLDGDTGKLHRDYDLFAWAVRDGDVVSVVPEPVSSILFIVGGASLGFRHVSRYKKRT